MPRRKAKAPVAVVTTREPWSPTFAELFRLASPEWTAPATVLIRHGVRRSSIVADFRNPAGQAFRLTTRIDRIAREVISEEMALRFSLKGKAA